MTGDAGFLEEMTRSSRERMLRAQRACSEAALLERARQCQPAPVLPADPAGFDLIAELKFRSPAAGRLQPRADDIAARVVGYARAGAAAVSILTEPTRFDGSLEHLELAARALEPLQVPVMRKDFIVAPYQIIEARVAGAGGVLVILRMLSKPAIGELLDCARSLGLFVLLEAFDSGDIETLHEILGAVSAPATVLAGLNCRDLTTLQIVPKRLQELAPLLPVSVPRVAESGVTSPSDAATVAAAGYQYALVGSALMGEDDPQRLAGALLKAGHDQARRDQARRDQVSHDQADRDQLQAGRGPRRQSPP